MTNANMREQIVETTVSSYFRSPDFNGCSVSYLVSGCGPSEVHLKELLSELIGEGLIEIMFGNLHPNPHIRAFSGIDVDEQLRLLEEDEWYGAACVYPNLPLLEGRPEVSRYEDRPFSKELALGSGQLDFRAFDLEVLERYRNDPRYTYQTDWINGLISVTDEYFESEEMPEHDQVLLQTFGFAYDNYLNRAVAVFLRYLHDLSPEHQQVWAAKRLEGDYKLHPDYYRNSILGDFGERLSIFDAFLQELALINEMAGLMGKPPLFRNDFSDATPRDFGFLIRPTLDEFNRFVHLLDKMMSENLNKKFFRGDISLEHEEERDDGKVVVTPLGTVSLLENWVTHSFRPTDPKPVDEMLATFKKVRKMRQKPAHSVQEDQFDQMYFKNQRELVQEAFNAIRTIRMILENHPAVKADLPDISRHLREGLVWSI